VVVEQAIREHAAFKRWALLAISVRSNHVHVMIRAGEPPERVMTGCKAWATRALRSGGVVGPEDRVWTRHGSTRWINDRESLDAAYTYITQAQDGEIAANRYGSRRKED
jgi:REP element-mobilizing transposase RayT